MKIKVIFLSFIFGALSLEATIGCMERYEYPCGGCRCNSDTYNYAKCSCPCRNIDSRKGKCLMCGHYGNPERGYINVSDSMPFRFQ